MANVFKPVQAGTEPLASDVDQLRMALTGTGDVGKMGVALPQAAPIAPALAINGATGNLNGTYKYKLVNATGWVDSYATTYISGFAPGAEATISVTNGQVNLTVPGFTAPVVGTLIYRTAANGASGTEQFVAAIFNATTLSYVDNIGDGSLGAASIPTAGLAGNVIPAAVPTSNTTGTTFDCTSVQGAVPGTGANNLLKLDSAGAAKPTGPVYLSGVDNVNAPPIPVILASPNVQGVGMTEYGDLVPINPANLIGTTYWAVRDKNGNPMWKVYLTGGSIDVEAYLRCYGGLYVPTGASCYLTGGVGWNYTWSGTINYNTSVTLTHNLGHYPIVTLSGSVGNLQLTHSFTDNNNIRIYNYSTSSNNWTGTVYLL